MKEVVNPGRPRTQICLYGGRQLPPVDGFPQEVARENFKALSWPAWDTCLPEPPLGPEGDRGGEQTCGLFGGILHMFAFPLVLQ